MYFLFSLNFYFCR